MDRVKRYRPQNPKILDATIEKPILFEVTKFGTGKHVIVPSRRFKLGELVLIKRPKFVDSLDVPELVISPTVIEVNSRVEKPKRADKNLKCLYRRGGRCCKTGNVCDLGFMRLCSDRRDE